MNMAWDVATAIRESGSVHGMSLLGGGPEIEGLARDLGCNCLEEFYDADLSCNLNMAARQLSAEGVEILVVIPGDLPMLRSQDIDDLLAQTITGLTVCPANRDGGTNALVITPPDAIQFYFGHRSAQRHLEAGQNAGLPSIIVERRAFAVDIDTPDDLIWLCRQPLSNRTTGYLDRTGLRTRILELEEALPA